MDVIGSGALNLDLMYEVEDLSLLRQEGIDLQPGQEIAVDFRVAEKILSLLDHCGKKVAESGGGSAANTICVLAALGLSTGFVGTVGNDEQADRVLSSMKGVDCSLVVQRGRTSLCIVLLDAVTRDRAMLVAPGHDDIDVSINEDLVHAISGTRVLHLSSMVQNSAMYFQTRMSTLLRRNQILSLDPGEIYASKGFDALSALIARTDLLFVTQQEVMMMTGEPLAKGLEVLLQRMRQCASESLPFQNTGGPVILCKQGRKGAVLYSPFLKTRVHAEKISRIVDNTGAGDSFDAGFLHAMLSGYDVVSCLSRAAEVAALSLGGYGRKWLDSISI